MLLGKPEILRRIAKGDIIVDEFKMENLGTAQYDVSIGENFYRERDHSATNAFRGTVYNPFDEKHVRAKWELNKAMPHSDWIERSGAPLENIGLDEKLIFLKPGEMILAHTVEFIGGTSNDLTTMMKARSSLGRNCVEVCRCAGMGDAGYFTRWTLEVVNTSRVDTIVIPALRRVGQLLFFKIDPVDEKDMYNKSGKYQTSADLTAIKAAWTPEQMLPKQWGDRESIAATKSVQK